MPCSTLSVVATALCVGPRAAPAAGRAAGLCPLLRHRHAAIGFAEASHSTQRQQQQQLSRRRLSLVAAAPTKHADDDACALTFVSADNQSDQDYTILNVEVPAFPGLLRTLAWVLNGLDMVAHQATIKTDAEGVAHNKFYVLTRRGKKLSDGKAELLAERVRDFMATCSGAQTRPDIPTEFCCGPICVSNSTNDEHTLVAVQEDRPIPGFLLDVASVLSGLNHTIQAAEIAHQDSCEGDWVTSTMDCGRTFNFCINNSRGTKLDTEEVSALVYVLSRVLGYRKHPLVPPDEEVLHTAH